MWCVSGTLGAVTELGPTCSVSPSLTIGYQYTTQVPCLLSTLMPPTPPTPKHPEWATSTGHHRRASVHMGVSYEAAMGLEIPTTTSFISQHHPSAPARPSFLLKDSPDPARTHGLCPGP